MISFYRKNFTYIILSLITIAGCDAPPNKVVKAYISPICIETQAPCALTNDTGEYSLAFDVAHVMSETPFHYYLTYQGEHKFIGAQGYVEGKNMYMGKIPVFFESTSNNSTFKGNGLLGSCSEDIMQWNLHIVVKLRHSQTQEEITKKIIFSYSSQRY